MEDIIKSQEILDTSSGAKETCSTATCQYITVPDINSFTIINCPSTEDLDKSSITESCGSRDSLVGYVTDSGSSFMYSVYK